MDKQKKNAGITLIALVISIIVMLILAGVSINATVGDNGIITNAMDADFKIQKAILEEYINQFYVEHFENMEDNTNRIAALQTIEESRNWIYRGKLGYVVDSDGYVHYFLIIENFPKEIREQIKVGLGEKKYSDYVNCNDVWGVTEDLKVYYCKNGQNSIDGAILGSLDQENGEDVVFKAGSPLAKKIKGNETDDVTKSDLRGISSFTLDKSTGVQNLKDMYNFPDLTELKIEDLDLTSLDGIEYLPKLKRIFFIRCKVESYKSLGIIPEQINYLFFEDTNNDEIEKFCSYEKGIGCDEEGKNGADFINLAYFGIYGVSHFTLDYKYDDAVAELETNESTKHSLFSNVKCLSNLSQKTKERISNLFLNNNSLYSIENLWEFKNVQLLRIEGNNLVNLNGLYNPNANPSGKSTKDKEQGMLNLKYLFANSNLLGKNERNELDLNNDGLSNLSKTSYDSTSGTYNFEPIFNNLEKIILSTNSNLKHLEYLYGSSKLSFFYFDNMSSLNLNGIQKILNIIEKENITYRCDEYVKNYIKDNSKKITIVDLNNKTMSVTEFKNFLDGRENYIKRLEIKDLTLTNNGINITNLTTPSYDLIMNETLGKLVNMEAIYINSSFLENINFVENMKTLYQIDLRGTHVSDLNKLCSIKTIASIIVDYSGIKIADSENLTNRNKEPSAIEKLFNSTYDTYFKTDNAKYPAKGVYLCSKALLEQLQYSTNIEKFSNFAWGLECSFGSENIVYDLSNTKITNDFIFGNQMTLGSAILKLPKSIKKIDFRNVRSNNKRRWSIYS